MIDLGALDASLRKHSGTIDARLEMQRAAFLTANAQLNAARLAALTQPAAAVAAIGLTGITPEQLTPEQSTGIVDTYYSLIFKELKAAHAAGEKSMKQDAALQPVTLEEFLKVPESQEVMNGINSHVTKLLNPAGGGREVSDFQAIASPLKGAICLCDSELLTISGIQHDSGEGRSGNVVFQVVNLLKNNYLKKATGEVAICGRKSVRKVKLLTINDLPALAEYLRLHLPQLKSLTDEQLAAFVPKLEAYLPTDEQVEAFESLLKIAQDAAIGEFSEKKYNKLFTAFVDSRKALEDYRKIFPTESQEFEAKIKEALKKTPEAVA